jgi:hypothetical protein
MPSCPFYTLCMDILTSKKFNPGMGIAPHPSVLSGLPTRGWDELELSQDCTRGLPPSPQACHAELSQDCTRGLPPSPQACHAELSVYCEHPSS